MCPGNQESAGKRKTGRTRKGNVWLRAALIESAHSLGRGRGTYLAAQYRRLTARRGKKKAAVALGHSILVIVYHLLSRGEVYHDLRAPNHGRGVCEPIDVAEGIFDAGWGQLDSGLRRSQ